jgi:hypothetical protein
MSRLRGNAALSSSNFGAPKMQVVVDAHGAPDRRGRVREHDVDFVERKAREEPVVICLEAHEMDGRLRRERRFEELLHQHFWEHFDDADAQSRRLPRRPTFYGVHELAAETEDFFRVAIHDAAEIGGDERTAALLEELLAERVFESVNLGA